MNSLLADATDDQRALLGIIHDEFERTARWPIWQYVDLTMKPVGRAERTLRSFPAVGALHTPGPRYGAVWWSSSNWLPSPETQVGLTIAGLNQIAPDSPLVSRWIELLKLLVSEQARLKPDPETVVRCEVSAAQIRQHLYAGSSTTPVTGEQAALRLEQLQQVARFERPLMGRIVLPAGGGLWSIEVPPGISRYEGIQTIEQYIERVTDILTPAEVPYTGSAPAGLSLPDALSFLDAVWHARVGVPLFERFDPSSIEKLSLPVTTPAELDAWTSAVADVLSEIRVPADSTIERRRKRPVKVLGEWLIKTLPEAEGLRVADEIDALARVGDIRVGAQHSAVRYKAVDAFEALGLRFPPEDWQATWTALQERVIGALVAIRQEVHAGLQSDSD
jgi:hypothetical protein